MKLTYKKIIITGGRGFIGSNFIDSIKNYDTQILNLDNLSYAARNEKIQKFNSRSNYNFLKIDINNKKKLSEVFSFFEPDLIINFAAETHVDRSIENPEIFLKTNILGVSNLLQVSLKYWKSKKKKKFLFVQISTDEVFGSLNFREDSKKETDAFDPSSPYSSSKASADLLVRSWYKTYGLPCITIYPTNNFGPWQYPEKFIPLMILKTILKKKLTVYGNGSNVREWIYVKDCVDGIVSVILRGKFGQSYNIGSGEQVRNLEVAKMIIEKINGKNENYLKNIEFVSDRPAHDLRYNLNSSKIQVQTNWKPRHSFKEALFLTIEWYLENLKWLKAHSKSYGVQKRIGRL